MNPDREHVTVWLGLPERRTGGWNVAPTGGGREVRYSAEVVLRRDENTGLQEKPVQVARKNFRILFEGESLEGQSALPLARLRRLPAGGVELDPGHVPPLLDFSASEALKTISRRLVELLTARSSSLSGARRQRNKGLAEFGVSDVASFWLLYTVNTHLPVIRHLHETRRGHPAELFEAMLALAGALTTFSATLHPRDLPVYAHADPGRSFQELDARIRELLETVVPSSYVSLPLKAVETTVHATALDDDAHLAAPRWYLAVAADLPARDLLARVPQLLKVASGDQVERLIRQALPGLTLVHDPDPPSQVPVRLDFHYFRVEKAGPVWEGIRRARNVAVHVPGDFPGARLELGILLA
jgi:type VI secretion system protein ImpJ